MPINAFLSKINEFEQVVYKTLAHNDYSWANHGTHQYGILITKNLAPLFPEVDQTQKIFTAQIATVWQSESGGWESTDSSLKYYHSKKEYRITKLPREYFEDISPGSVMFIGRLGHEYYCTVADPQYSDPQVLLDALDLREAPSAGLVEQTPEGLVEQISGKIFTEVKIDRELTAIPPVEQLSDQAYLLYISDKEFPTKRPGDVLDELVNFEFNIYKRYEAVYYGNSLAKVSLPEILRLENLTDVKSFYANSMEPVGVVYMGMFNARKSRVGKTFEMHIKRLFDQKSIPYDYQKKVDGKKKPDFIMPSKKHYLDEHRDLDDALLVSVKTTLKERWQQILNEGSRVKTRYLLTLDKAVTADTISEMSEKHVVLVVTEWAKQNTESYIGAGNVITFSTFLADLERKQQSWPSPA